MGIGSGIGGWEKGFDLPMLFEMDATFIGGKWKLSQNKSAEIQGKVAAHMESGETGAKAVAVLMRANLRARLLPEMPPGERI